MTRMVREKVQSFFSDRHLISIAAIVGLQLLRKALRGVLRRSVSKLRSATGWMSYIAVAASAATFHEEKYRRGVRLITGAAAAESSPSPAAVTSSIDEIVKYLTTLGWERAWIDGVTERIAKKQISPTAETLKAACEYLLSVGISEGQLCNMVSLCHSIVNHEVEGHLKPIIEFLKARGVENIPKLLTMRPKLLDYRVSEDGSVLSKGKLRVAIRVEKRNGTQEVLVVTYREGAAFNTAPVTPYAP